MEQNSDLVLISQREAARLLASSVATLRRWGRSGDGPPWVRLGERLVRYDMADLRRWVAALGKKQ